MLYDERNRIKNEDVAIRIIDEFFSDAVNATMNSDINGDINNIFIAFDESDKISPQLQKYIDEKIQQFNRNNQFQNKKITNIFATATPHYADLLRDKAKGGDNYLTIVKASNDIILALNK